MSKKAETDPPKDAWFSIKLFLFLAVFAVMGSALCIFLLKINTIPGAADAPVLEILNTDSGKIYSRRPMNNGDEFAIEFIHSVHNSPVREIFKIERGSSAETWEIRPTSVRFFSYGAGMQTELEDGQEMLRDGDALVISGFNRAFTELNYIVGTISDHLLLVSGQTISLRNLCGKNAHVTIRIR